MNAAVLIVTLTAAAYLPDLIATARTRLTRPHRTETER